MRFVSVRALATVALLSALAVPSFAADAPAVTGPYQIDSNHSNVGFQVRHNIVSKVNGRFSKFSGTIDFDPVKPTAAKIQAEIDANSINTDNEKRDGHLRSPDFFDTANNPKILFESTGITVKDKSNYQMSGNLTMRGVTKPVTLDVEMLGQQGNRVGFEAKTRVNRKDYGINWNRALDNGGFVLSDDVDIVIQIEAVKRPPEAAAPAAPAPAATTK